MTRDLSRLFSPRSVAVIGGGTWCANVVAQADKIGFAGDIWPLHPHRSEIAGHQAYPAIAALPAPPDAAFVGINREATIDAIAELAAIGAGGAVAFASGFREAGSEDAAAPELQSALLGAAGDMPVLGPNCYGFVNALDNVALWPDQHGLGPVESGVAIIAQSSNLAINISMQRRALPIAALVTIGNQAQTGLSEIGQHLLADPRITALGLYIEGIDDLRAFEHLAASCAKPIVALKVGRSDLARAAARSHTASLAGEAQGASALFARLGIGEVTGLSAFLDALHVLHLGGPLPHARLASMSCSGGEASLISDAAHGTDISFPALIPRQTKALAAALGPRVALANPLDYHTYIWGDVARMTDVFAAMADPDLAITLLVLDLPRADRCDPSAWDCAIEAINAARQRTGQRYGVVASLPDNMPETVALAFAAQDIVPLAGFDDAIVAILAAARCHPARQAPPVLHGTPPANPVPLDEHDAKCAIVGAGVPIPNGLKISDTAGLTDAAALTAPLVMKSLTHAHKSEHGHVVLDMDHADLADAAATLPGPWRIEEMVTGAVAELLVGITRDPAHGVMLTLGAGGTLAEILDDTATLLVPAGRDDIRAALGGLRISALLNGYRGKPPADMDAVIDVIERVQQFARTHVDRLGEMEINPLIVTPTAAIAADALIYMETP